ncbi:hypothetical protein JCM10212_005699 [Sporobolomyces blumeae]
MSPSLSELQSLKRKDLQTLCKKHSLKANGTNDALIQSLTTLFATIEPADDAVPQVENRGGPAMERPVQMNEEPMSHVKTNDINPAPRKAAVETNRPPTSSSEDVIRRIDSTTARIDETCSNQADILSQVERQAARIAQLEDMVRRLTDQVNGFVTAQMERERIQADAREQGSREEKKRFDDLEAAVADMQAKLDEGLRQPRDIAAGATRVSPEVRESLHTTISASPSMSDAPPTTSLFSFYSSPRGSPAPSGSTRPQSISLDSTSRRAESRQSGAGRTSTPRLSALPAHLSRNFPRTHPADGSPAPSTILASTALPRAPESPVAPVPNAFLGKRSRDSDASNLSVGLETIVSPPSQTNPSSSLFSDSVRPMPSSAKKSDGHSRKRLRMSMAAEDDDDTFTVGDDEEEQYKTSTEGSELDGGDHRDDDEDEDEPDSDVEDSNDSVRDYLMPTKTGDSPSTTLKPASAVPTSDPSFFSIPVSPSRSTPGRRSNSGVDENVAPSVVTSTPGPRKSLPLAALPFPLVSPFAKDRSAPKKSGTRGTTTAFGSSTNTQRFSTTLSRSAHASIGPPSSKRSIPPPTPDAPRTLFGTESFPFSDGFDEESRDGQSSRYDDGFATAEEDVTERDDTWSRFQSPFARV